MIQTEKTQIIDENKTQQIALTTIQNKLINTSPMFIIGAEIQEINFILHIGDIHIGSGNNRHAEYRLIFDKLARKISDWPTDRGTLAIFIAGDIFHFKTKLMPEDIELFYYLLGIFSEHPIIIIPGNHDTNLSNRTSIDLISPLLRNYKTKHNSIYYLRDTGIYTIGGYKFLHISVFDEINTSGILEMLKTNENNELTSQTSQIKPILLYHGMINGARFGTHLHNESRINAEILRNVHFAMLGDIHEWQIIANAAYCGSLIQQNMGENLSHGYIMWSCKNGSKIFQNVENDSAYLKIDLTKLDWKKDWVDKPLPKQIINLCVVVKNDMVDNDEIRNVEKFFNAKATKIAVRREKHEKITPNEFPKLIIGDSRPDIIGGHGQKTFIDFQKTILKELLEGLPEKNIAAILDIHNSVVQAPIGDYTRKRNKWFISRIEWSNLFKYGCGNEIDFTKINGISGIIAENRAGKSSVIDIIAFGLFGEHMRGDNTSIINWSEKTSNLKIYFMVNENPHRVEIQLSRTKAKQVKLFAGDAEITAETVINTYNKITSLIGTFAEFVATALYTQDTPDIIKMKKTERKKQLGALFGIEDISAGVEKAKKEYKTLKEDLQKQQKPKLENHQMQIDILENNYKLLHENYTKLQIDKTIVATYINALEVWIKTYGWSENIATEISELQKSASIHKTTFVEACAKLNIDPKEVTAQLTKTRDRATIEREIKNIEKWFETKNISKPDKSKIENYMIAIDDRIREKIKNISQYDGQLLKLTDKHKIIAKKYESNIAALDKSIVELSARLDVDKKIFEALKKPNYEIQTIRAEIDTLNTELATTNQKNTTLAALELSFKDITHELSQQKFKFNKDCTSCTHNNKYVDSRAAALRQELEAVEAKITAFNKSEISAKLAKLTMDGEEKNKLLDAAIKYTQCHAKYREEESQLENMNMVRLYIKQSEELREKSALELESKSADKNYSALIALYDEQKILSISELQNLAAVADIANDKYAKRIKLLEDSKNAIPDMPDALKSISGGKINNDKFKHHLRELDNKIEEMIVMKTRTKIDLDAYTCDLNIFQQYAKIGAPLEDSINNYKKYIDIAGKALQFRLIKQYMKNIEIDLNNILMAVCNFHLKIETSDDGIEFLLDENGHQLSVDMGSGYQKFIVCLAFRLALINNLQSTADFIFVDEGFGCIDGNNLKHIGGLFMAMKDIFKFIFVISHVDELNNIIEFPLYIKHVTSGKNQYSFLNNTLHGTTLIQEQINLLQTREIPNDLIMTIDETPTIADSAEHIKCKCGSKILAKNYQKHILSATHLKKTK